LPDRNAPFLFRYKAERPSSFTTSLPRWSRISLFLSFVERLMHDPPDRGTDHLRLSTSFFRVLYSCSSTHSPRVRRFSPIVIACYPSFFVFPVKGFGIAVVFAFFCLSLTLPRVLAMMELRPTVLRCDFFLPPPLKHSDFTLALRLMRTFLVDTLPALRHPWVFFFLFCPKPIPDRPTRGHSSETSPSCECPSPTIFPPFFPEFSQTARVLFSLNAFPTSGFSSSYGLAHSNISAVRAKRRDTT